MAKADAYDKRTGKKLPYKVPEKWFELPFSNLRKTPIQKASEASKTAGKASSKKEG